MARPKERKKEDGLINAIDSGDFTYCADLSISDDAADELIATAINANDSTDCADDAADGLISAIDDVDLTD